MSMESLRKKAREAVRNPTLEIKRQGGRPSVNPALHFDTNRHGRAVLWSCLSESPNYLLAAFNRFDNRYIRRMHLAGDTVPAIKTLSKP